MTQITKPHQQPNQEVNEMTNPSIFTRSEAESDTVYNPKSGFHTNVAVTGEHLQMIWAKLEPEGGLCPSLTSTRTT